MKINQENILVTGANGQLGSEIFKISKFYSSYNYFFESKNSLDITNFHLLNSYIRKNKISTVINCAAYTNVDEAETEHQIANQINFKSVSKLAKICKENNIKLIHISTDFVFDGKKKSTYNENDKTNPINVYGKTKLRGENSILELGLKNSLIIRTSWLYSGEGDNFVNKLCENFKKFKQINLPTDEVGSPTYATKLAENILRIIPKIKNKIVEKYHYSDKGFCSRYEFGLAIAKFKNSETIILPKKTFTNSFRPKFSALNSDKIINKFSLNIFDWEYNLKEFLTKNTIK